MRSCLCLLGALFISGATLSAQHEIGAQDAPVFRASTHLVTIDAVVTDGDGKLVTNLTRDDFDVTVSGRRQTLEQALYIRTQDQPQAWAAARAATIGSRNGAPEPRSETAASRTLRTTATAPDKIARTIALVVDDLGLSFQSMFYVRNAVHKYIDTQIEPGDLVAIVRTAGGVGALQQFTTDKRLLHLAADRLLWGVRKPRGICLAGWRADWTSRPVPRDAHLGRDRWRRSSTSRGACRCCPGGSASSTSRKASFDLRRPDGAGDSRSAGSGRIWRAMARDARRARTPPAWSIYTIDARACRLAIRRRLKRSVASDGPRGELEQRVPWTASASELMVTGFLDTPSARMGAGDRR